MPSIGDSNTQMRELGSCPAQLGAAPLLTASQRMFLLQLARRTVEAAVDVPPKQMAAPEADDLEPPLRVRRACFVTLEKQGGLRGCIGHLLAHDPLYLAVMEAARQCSTADPRFPRVQPDEVVEITLEISVLSDLTPLTFTSVVDLLDQLKPHHHGVALHFEERTSTFLPQVWEQIPAKSDFLDRLAVKGGWEPSVWRTLGARLSVYTVESFRE